MAKTTATASRRATTNRKSVSKKKGTKVTTQRATRKAAAAPAPAPRKQSATRAAAAAPAPRKQSATAAAKMATAQHVHDHIMDERDEFNNIGAATVITDYNALRAAATAAMGAFADKAEGDALVVRLQKRGIRQKEVYEVHPLDLHVPNDDNGSPRINRRNWDGDVLRNRVYDFSTSISNRGLDNPLRVFMRQGKIFVWAGETRLRSIYDGHIRAAAHEASGALEKVTVLFEKEHTNDADRVLNVVADNDSLRHSRLQIAENVRQAIDLGASKEKVALRFNKTVSWVNNLLEILTLPQAVLNLIHDDKVRANFAMSTYIAQNEDTAGTLDVLNGAIQVASLLPGSKRAMPKHSGVVSTRESTTTATPRTKAGERAVRANDALVASYTKFKDEVSAFMPKARRTGEGYTRCVFELPDEEYDAMAAKTGWMVLGDADAESPPPPPAESPAIEEEERKAA